METIKEIALKVAQSTNLHYIVTSERHTNDDWNIRFAEALIAEIQKQNEPVVWWNKDTCQFFIGEIADVERKDLFEPLYAFPPIPEPQWKSIDSAPKDKRCIVWSGQEMYCAHWSQNPFTGDEAWIVAEWGSEGDQALVKPTHWLPLPEAPKGEQK